MFEYVDRGTLFLDEIGEVRIAAQSKLLRILQNQELRRVGSPVARTVDVHVIAATNRDVRELAFKGQFRQDLFYRLSMIEIQLLPLVDRMQDLPLLQQHTLRYFSAKPERRTFWVSVGRRSMTCWLGALADLIPRTTCQLDGLPAV